MFPRLTQDRQDDTARIAPHYFQPNTYEIAYGTLDRAQGQVSVRVIDRTDDIAAAEDFFSVARHSTGSALDVLANDQTLPGLNNSFTLSAVTSPSEGGQVAAKYDDPNGVKSGSV